MPQKTREQKMRAAARKHTPSIYTKELVENAPLKKTIKESHITTEEAAEDKMTRHFFLVDFRKSLIITVLIIAFEVAVKFVQLDQLLAQYLKI